MYRAGPIAPLPPFHLLPKYIYVPADSESILDICEERSKGGEPIYVYDERTLEAAPSPPLPAANLHPKVPVFEIRGDYDIGSGELEKFLKDHPLALIRGLTKRVGFDVALFSPESLSRVAPSLSSNGLYLQPRQDPDSNTNTRGQSTWLLASTTSTTTMKQQAEYYKKELAAERRRNGRGAALNSEVRFGVFSLPEADFKEQHEAIGKLPKILRPLEHDDVITYSGMQIDGLYGCYSFIKTQGVRTAAHVEDGAVPSINVGCGPGASDWLAVPKEFVSIVEREALKKGLKFGEDQPIWPNWQELEAMGVPVWRFSQKKDEIVYTGAGVLHWVQGEGVGVNAAWNAGPISPSLIHNCIRQQEKNVSMGLSSTIPMERVCWRIAERNDVTDWETYKSVRDVLICSLANAKMAELWLEENKVPIKEMNDELKEEVKEAALYCEECKRELFSLFFIDKNDDGMCLLCVEKRRSFRGLECIRQFAVDDLANVFDAFTQPPIVID